MQDNVTLKVRQFAQRLLAYEATTSASPSPGNDKSPAFRVCEKLRQPLSRLTGVAGFRSLLSRALTLASGETSWLKAIQIGADGSLEGFDDSQTQLSKQEIGRGEILLVAHLIGLLVTFIGEGLTMRLLQQEWPDVAFDNRQG